MVRNYVWKSSAAALMIAAGAALAQPANDACSGAIEVLGSFPALTEPVDFSIATPTAEFAMCSGGSYTIWYKLTAANNGTITVVTCAADTPGTTHGDTVLALYSSGDGSCDTLTQLACNDDFCGLRSTVTAPATAGVTYYIQAAKYQTGAPAPGAMIQLKVTAPNLIEPPTGTGQATPNSIENCGDSPVLFEVATLPGNLPASTVTIDLSSVGGSSTQAMSDPESDGTFSVDYTVPGGAAPGARILAFNVADSAGRSTNGNLTLNITPCPPQNPWQEDGDAGELTDSAQTPVGSGPMSGIVGSSDGADADMYLIDICDAANFSATTRVFTTVDTQLFLFNLDGTGVTYNDDSPSGTLQSTITNTYVPAAGQYYLAISRYNRDPVDGDGQLMWVDTPFNVERAPDGPGAGGSVGGWTGTTSGLASYTISFTGVCYPGGGGCGCPADYNQDGGVDGGDVESFFLDWEGSAGCSDTNQDGGIDGADVESFFVAWEAGGCG